MLYILYVTSLLLWLCGRNAILQFHGLMDACGYMEAGRERERREKEERGTG